jgi:hypothetical protein
MAQHPNLRLQGTTWHFRRRVPAPVKERLGRHEIVRSLTTSSLSLAASRARLLWLSSDAMFRVIMEQPTLTANHVYGGEKLGHWSVVFVAMRAE